MSSKEDRDALEDALRIDRHALDDELMRQPHTYHEAAKASAIALSRRDKAKDWVKRAEAKAYGRVRARLEASGAKVTEPLIAAQIELDPEVIEGKDALVAAGREASLWEVLSDAWLQRSYALKDLVQLHTTAYNQSPSSTAGSAAKARELEYDEQRRRMAEQRRGREEESRRRVRP